MAGVQEETVLQPAVFDTDDISLHLDGTSREMILIKKQVDALQQSERCQTQTVMAAGSPTGLLHPFSSSSHVSHREPQLELKIRCRWVYLHSYLPPSSSFSSCLSDRHYKMFPVPHVFAAIALDPLDVNHKIRQNL